MVISIEKAQYLSGYKILLKFSDKVEKTIDFEPFLKKALNPMTTQYMDVSKFKQFKIEHGDLIWNDYEMCFPIWDLYSGFMDKSGDAL